MNNREAVNKELEGYTEDNCHWCYAEVLEDGRVHLDDKFDMRHLRGIMKILEKLDE